MDDGDFESEQAWTAYHEAGHAVIAFALGGQIDSIQLGGQADEHLPERFGDCRVNWGPVDPNSDWQCQREVMTILAGPVAEMIFRGEPFHPAYFGPFKDDWQRAWVAAAVMATDDQARARLLEKIIQQLYLQMMENPFWPAIAAVADELMAHEFLEEDQLSETIGFWLRSFQ